MDLKALRNAVRTTPIVDNHAHPLLKAEHQTKHSLLSIATEAHGDALNDSPSSLAHIRGVKQLAGLLDVEPTWEAVEPALQAKRSSQGPGTSAGDWTDWVRSCMQGIETLLLDDGLDSGDETHEYGWHDQFVTGKCKRIVRIEALAVDIIRRHIATASKPEQWERRAVLRILGDFEREIGRCLADPEVVGFKSIICYRGGLDIPSKTHMESQTQIQATEEEIGGIAQRGEFTRLQHKALNHFLIHAAAKLIATSSSEKKKPIQFHTGLGDNDIILTKSSPSHLQTFIADYPTVPIVILHASYPWTREAGYLAAMYPNVYADVGEVFPFISRQGQESVMKQILELCPWSKILWSTDGHWFPETYVLATMQMREVLETTLCDLVREGDLSEHQAIQLVQDILFTNSKKLYNLQTEIALPKPESISTTTLAKSQSASKPSSRPKQDVAKVLHQTSCKWVRLVWVDYTASTRCRVIPVKQVLKALKSSGGKGTWTNTMAAFGLLQIDMPIPQITSTGMYKLDVDWTSLRAGPVAGHMSCFSEFREPDGAESPLCPRTLLRNAVEKAKSSHGLSFLLGFEIEFVVMERCTTPETFRMPKNDDGHAWAMARSLADTGRPGSFNSLIDGELADALDAAGIEIEQYHAESAPGQYEIVLPALPPLEACDTLVHARQIIESVAARHGFRVTLHPKPFAMFCGTASHVHMSVASDILGEDNPEVYEPFYAGILRHFPAVIAFTYSNPVSYERMVDSYWAGGRWIMWGRQNKESPLRQCGGEPGTGPTSHWEMKCLDGLANPYFAAAAILSAGTLGVATKEPMVWRDCSSDPAKLTPEQRKEFGITQMFPTNLGEALAALQADTALIEQLGSPEFVQRYVDVKNAEMGILSQMGEDQRRVWIMERY
ncbi:hypothetical protein PG996_006627 [Apiospora saccharicola]|uniref:Glutamine synthetase n=1 Tax=Apiospora saccharicola TaxID=335842 RepID=A0ABR1V8I4_9PEZI